MPTIIRATDQNMVAASVAFNFDDMASQAKRYLDQTRVDAAKIVVQAQQEAAGVRAQAQAQGRQAALAEVDQMIQRQLATVIPALRQAILDIHQAKQAWLAQWETAAIHLAAEIARRLIRRELSRQPEIPLTLIREALQMAAGNGSVRLLLNPNDQRALGGPVQLLVAEMSGLGETQIVADASVSPGGCRVETRFGSIDQTFEAQLARVEEELGAMTIQAIAQLDRVMTTAITGSVAQTVGTTIAAAGFPVPIGAIAEIERESGSPLPAEVIGFRNDWTLLYALSSLTGIRHGNRVRLRRTARWLPVGPGLLGRILNSSGRAVDGKPQPALTERASLDRQPPHACTRPRIERPLATGIRAIDGLLTCGKGQRMGVFAGSGVGKSVLLGMMARHALADVNVIALIGERGREVNEFIERDVGPQGLARSVVLVATSDEPALVRVQAAATAMTIAEYFRDQGKDVLLLMDSVTRYAMAQREIGLAAGEPPATRGYPPSVFALLPKLIERAGRSPAGSITAFFTVLVEGDDPNEPIADTVRGLLDGHTWLSRSFANRGHYPSIDVLSSLSRLMADLVGEEHRRTATLVRSLLAAYRDHEDLISIGAYRRGGNKLVDTAIDMQDDLNAFLRQRIDQPSSVDDARQGLLALHQKAQKHLATGVGGKA